jgi:hypothetical protein
MSPIRAERWQKVAFIGLGSILINSQSDELLIGSKSCHGLIYYVPSRHILLSKPKSEATKAFVHPASRPNPILE